MKVLVCIPMDESHKSKLERAVPSAEYTYMPAKEVTRELLSSVDVIIGNPPAALYEGLTNLKWVQLSSAGVNDYLRVLPESTLLTNMTGAFGLAISEYMVAVLCMMYKKLHLYRDNQLKGVWLDEGKVKKIEGSTVLVVGLGDIGGDFARRMKALGAYVIGVRRANLEKPPYVDELHLFDELDGLLPRADAVTLSLPSTSDTHHLFDAGKLAQMKSGAFLVNVGRGDAVVTDDLCDALESGHLGGAALDVTEPEPLPDGHRLWGIRSAIVTPHVSGFYHLDETYERSVNIAAENLVRFANGQELLSLVDRATGYRKTPTL
ncbi:Glyoxylate/hydroxypyruvate reductase A [bioreactor metagenome]|uniref:Glyoxylate/hydroxypyruvate reductase A n=1 Tax=bioreactor metagenome TaxID=1076179 RepID=A0A644XV50_9ZZZZ